MTRSVLLAAGALLLGAAGTWYVRHSSAPDVLFEPKYKPLEAAALCPWRDPSADLASFFPSATRFVPETRILSGLRQELAVGLGRAASGDENALPVHRVYQGDKLLGNVLTRRVKGEHGAIEIVLATSLDGSVHGLRLQRLREPESNARLLQDPAWLTSFVGHRAGDALELGRDLKPVPDEARDSALAITDGVRSLLVMLSVSSASSSASQATHHASD